MKKILTVALVAMLTAASLFAGVSFSGRFRQGYVLTVKDGALTSKEWKSEEAKLVMKFADDNGVWSVALKNTGALDSNDKWAANATVDVKKALAAAGVDTGDFGLKVSLGNNSKMTALSAYDDAVTGSEYYKLKNNGTASFQLAASYKMVKFNVAVDPTKFSTETKGSYVIDQKTGDVVKKDDSTSDSKPSAVVSAQINPVDGVSVAAAFAYKGWFKDQYKEVKDVNIVGGSVKVDVAKLADLDFALSFAAYDNFALGETKNNSLAANIYGGYGKVDGGVEFVMNSAIASETKSTMGLNAIVNFAATDDLSFDVYANIDNLSKIGDTLAVGADSKYSLAGVDLGLNLNYSVGAKEFSATPKMIIVF